LNSNNNNNKNQIIISLKNDDNNISIQKKLELSVLEIFQHINLLGHYSEYKWFLSLDKTKLLRFLKELIDIWNFRAGITTTTKCNIFPPRGDLFKNVQIRYLHNEPNINNIKQYIVNLLHKLVFSGIDKDSQTLGSYYILISLTLVNQNAANALPWLYNSAISF
jgi:hypothetical protein